MYGHFLSARIAESQLHKEIGVLSSPSGKICLGNNTEKCMNNLKVQESKQVLNSPYTPLGGHSYRRHLPKL